MKRTIILSSALAFGLQASSQENVPIAQEQPNILVFMVDQLIPFYTGIYGNKIVKTPHLDELAKSGVVFNNAYTTCPVCVPSRYSLLTGMYLASHGAFDNGGDFFPKEFYNGKKRHLLR